MIRVGPVGRLASVAGAQYNGDDEYGPDGTDPIDPDESWRRLSVQAESG
jgi:hypothetical protein